MNLKNRAAFALPMAILVIAVLTAALAAAFTASGAEIGTNAAQRGTDRAFAIAQTGLEQFLVRRNDKTFCPVPTNCMADPTDNTNNGLDSVVFAVPGGWVEVVSRRVRPNIDQNNPAMFFIRARGVDTSRSGLSGAGATVRATRTVGLYASWNTNTMKVLSSWTSLGGLNKQGTAGVISGVDQCGQKPSVAGVAVPKGDLHISGNWLPSGNPPADTFKTATQLQSQIGIDWAAIKYGNAIPADFLVPPDAFPTTTWFANNPDAWPVVHVTTDFALPSQGRGMLIVDGNLSITGSDMWDGVILVGGSLTSNGNNTVAGATVSGLNKLLGETPDTSVVNSDNDDANGNKDYVYSSCKISKATQGLQKYRTLPNTWMDNVVTW